MFMSVPHQMTILFQEINNVLSVEIDYENENVFGFENPNVQFFFTDSDWSYNHF